MGHFVHIPVGANHPVKSVRVGVSVGVCVSVRVSVSGSVRGRVGVGVGVRAMVRVIAYASLCPHPHAIDSPHDTC